VENQALDIFRAHHQRPRNLLRQNPQRDLAEPELVADLEARAFHLAAVDEDAVGAARVAHRDSLRAGFQDRMPSRTLHVVQDQVAGGIASQGRNAALELDFVRASLWIVDFESHAPMVLSGG
jgi:hypothetical protein